MCSHSMMSHDLFLESHGRTGQGWGNSEVIRWSEWSLLTSDVRTLAKCSPQAVTISGGQLLIVTARTLSPQCSYLYLPVKLQQDCLDWCGGEVDIPTLEFEVARHMGTFEWTRPRRRLERCFCVASSLLSVILPSRMLECRHSARCLL